MAKIHKGKNLLKSKRNGLLLRVILIIIFIIGDIGLIFKIDINIKYKLILIVPSIIGIFLIRYYWKNFKIVKSGVAGENIGLKIAKKLPRSYEVFSNIFLHYKGQGCEIDLVVIGDNGVFVIEVKNHNGSIAGRGYDSNWTQHKVGKNGGKYTKRINNPIKQLKKQIHIFSQSIKKEGINIWIDGIILFTNKGCNLGIKNSDTTIMSVNDNNIVKYITNHKGKKKYNRGDLDKIKKFLIKHQK